MSYANRGMGFELLIEQTNRMYEAQGRAVVHKRPTPVRILEIRKGRVTGFLESASTVDYSGFISGGRAISFEAKEVLTQERFPLDNIKEHQFEHLKKCHELGGIAFVMIDFPKLHTTYLLHFKTLESYWNRWKTDGARGTASIPKDELDVYAHVVPKGRVPVDYLAVVTKVWEGEGHEQPEPQTSAG